MAYLYNINKEHVKSFFKEHIRSRFLGHSPKSKRWLYIPRHNAIRYFFENKLGEGVAIKALQGMKIYIDKFFDKFYCSVMHDLGTNFLSAQTILL